MPIFGLFDKATAAPSTTRFETSPELTHVATLIAQLRSKEVELEQAALAKGGSSIDKDKQNVVADLLTEFEKHIVALNSRPDFSNDEEKIKTFAAFAETLLGITTPKLAQHDALLNTMRNNNKQLANTYTKYSSVFVATAVAILTPLSFVTGALNIGIAKVASDKVRDWTGLTQEGAATHSLLTRLAVELDKVSKNLTQSLTIRLV